MATSLGEIYLQSVITRMTGYKELADKTFEQLVEKDFYFKPNETSNSIAIIIQHMSGNMLSRWTNFLGEDGEKTWRMRDEEFEEHSYSKQQLLDKWNKGWDCLVNSLRSLTEADLLKTIHIRNEPLSAIDAINRQLAHYPHHVGQILYIGKMIKGDQWKNLSMPKRKSNQK
ncbi:MAG: DUF1572 family protein [Bacteroidetes bacterium]|nr:DUF1572 family protein [Bacteroidota bacterium]